MTHVHPVYLQQILPAEPTTAAVTRDILWSMEHAVNARLARTRILVDSRNVLFVLQARFQTLQEPHQTIRASLVLSMLTPWAAGVHACTVLQILSCSHLAGIQQTASAIEVFRAKTVGPAYALVGNVRIVAFPSNT